MSGLTVTDYKLLRAETHLGDAYHKYVTWQQGSQSYWVTETIRQDITEFGLY